jgi:hypothetical protein
MGTKENIDLESEDRRGSWEDYEQGEATSEELDEGVYASFLRWVERIESYPPLLDVVSEDEQVSADLKDAISFWFLTLRVLVRDSADVVKALVEYGGAYFLGVGYYGESIARDALAQLSSCIKSLQSR